LSWSRRCSSGITLRHYPDVGKKASHFSLLGKPKAMLGCSLRRPDLVEREIEFQYIHQPIRR
jgi:hypothetical protein